MQYFSRKFTMNHILPYVQLPAVIKVHCIEGKQSQVKMVMSKSEVKRVPKGGAMITTNWGDIVKKNGMRVKNKFVFWFRPVQEGGLKLMVDIL